MDFGRAGPGGPAAVRERMGSGGPRGLQIPRLDVKSVRGGFDSHAFPPSRRRAVRLVAGMAACLALGAGTGPAGATTPPDAAGPAPEARAMRDSSSGSPRDLAGPGVTPVDGRRRGVRFDRRADAVPDSAGFRARRGRFEAPRWVMLRSLAVPGWGQLHNGSWLKAALLGGGEVWIVAGLLDDERSLRRLRTEVDLAKRAGDNDGFNAAVDAYNDRLDRIVARQWWLGGLLFYALTDAYVDAHFRDFKVEFEYDRALPGGKPPGGQARLSVGWDF
jgi:hypothetical protein